MRFSVVISALDEQYLHKTINTILEKSDGLLLEIIVVDDCSEEPIVCNHPSVIVVRNSQREGLIRARNIGTNLATGEFVVSIDAHCKVGSNWLEPIADILDQDHKNVVLPVTVGLDPEKWEASGSIAVKTAWRWNLDFYWHSHDQLTEVSPAMAGHCFAFTKRWWSELGGFDDGMEQWGGENIEFSLRTWLCGGAVKIARDSIVAHWFKKGFHYQVTGKNLLRNKARMAEVWLDDYKHMFYDAVGNPSIDVGDISKQLAIKAAKQVRPFSWFMDNLQPELKVNLLKNRLKGSRVAIVGAGPTIDKIPSDFIKLFDYVIGINYVSLIIDCDFVVFHDLKPAMKVLHSRKYAPSQLFVPLGLKDGPDRHPSHAISKDWNIYELGPQDQDKPLKNLNPPFFHHATSAHTAVHIAMFMGAKSISLFGCDVAFSADGRSHSQNIPEYKDGYYWSKNEVDSGYIERINRGYQMLRSATSSFGVDFLRYTYA